MTRTFLIALTGSIGVGKSTVASLLAEHGARVVSGDVLGRRALEESPQNLAAVRERFGPDVFETDGRLRRRELGQRVFASQDDVTWLTRLTFPRIHELWLESVNKTTTRVVVFDAALIFKWGIEREFDLVMLVTAPMEVISKRMSEDSRFTPEEWNARRRMQIAESVKSGKADVVIQNDGAVSDLRTHVQQIWQNVIEPRLQKGIS